MDIIVDRTGDAAVIKVSGRVEMDTSPALRNMAFALFRESRCRNVTVDFSEVYYIDTSGLATLIEIRIVAAEHRGQLTLSGLNQRAAYLLEINGLTPFFNLQTSSSERRIA